MQFEAPAASAADATAASNDAAAPGRVAPRGLPADPQARLQRLERALRHALGKAITDWKLIEDGDHIMVGLSGGKDSFTLLHLLRLLQRKAPVEFRLTAVTLDQGHPGFPADALAAWLTAQGYDFRIVKEDTYSIVKEKIAPGEITCPLCSRLRRGILYNVAAEMGCTKIALGHHREDLCETLLLNLFFAGQLRTMPVRLHSDDRRNVVIRPLAYCPEDTIAEYARLLEFPIIPCNLCGSQENLQRKKVKAWLSDLEAQHPGIKRTMLAALGNVVPQHLLDPRFAPTGADAAGLGAHGVCDDGVP